MGRKVKNCVEKCVHSFYMHIINKDISKIGINK